MLDKETKEMAIGLASDYTDPECPFCQLISKSIHLSWGEGQAPQLFIQSRSPLSVKVGGHITHPEPRLLLAVDKKPPGLHKNRRVIRQIDRVKDRFIVAEIERLPLQDNKATEEYSSPIVQRREVGSHVEIALLKTWLTECRTQHAHSLDKTNLANHKTSQAALFSYSPSPTIDATSGNRAGFQLIDVESQCLVRLTSPVPFLALSYVWGRLPTIVRPGPDPKKPDQILLLLATKKNNDSLSVPGALAAEKIPDKTRIPGSVLDAMAVTRELGERYLWMDMLCIIQDDDAEKGRMMGLMDHVYDAAVATLIAAEGKDADAGLRGWQGSTSQRRGRPVEGVTIVANDGDEKNKTLRLAVCPPGLVEDVGASYWNTRGWTFQEQHLSRRCIYFTAEEVFFTCVQGQLRRESYADVVAPPGAEKLALRTGPPWWTAGQRNDPDPTPYRYMGNPAALRVADYQAAVQAYSRMDLSHVADALNAFAGVFNRLNLAAASHRGLLTITQTQGVPVQFMYQGLLWFPSDDPRCKRRAPELTDKDKVKFSSWSWASWIGPIEFVFADSAWLSRIISLAPARHVPLHVAIPRWQFGNTDGTITTVPSHGSWAEPAGGERRENDTERYLTDHLGIDASTLRKQPALEVKLGPNEMGFWAAHLASEAVKLTKPEKPERFLIMDIPGSGGERHREGEFRFDDANETRRVDAFVLVLASETLQDAPSRKTQSVFLGFAGTKEQGVFERVGLGFVYFTGKGDDADTGKPSWEYKYFRVV
ncbi:heterokaryon incompatibility protein-domain-containing protein [Cladorrhinum sp. PSN259]|nr:heterokaryon incompatibility protein-domain-containing protein [Cladorrhinum sp. PSN259]